MSRKQDAFYFETFVKCADYACVSADILDEALKNFTSVNLKAKLEEIHKAEHAADQEKHRLMEVLAKAFITPVEREDIIQLSHNIDEVSDQIEDVLLRVYCNNVQSIREDALKMVEVVKRCCGEMKNLVAEFADFKHSKRWYDNIVNINNLEEEADQLFISCMRDLHTTCGDPLTVISWREIYIYLERCVDSCEHVADTIESIILKNS